MVSRLCQRVTTSAIEQPTISSPPTSSPQRIFRSSMNAATTEPRLGGTTGDRSPVKAMPGRSCGGGDSSATTGDGAAMEATAGAGTDSATTAGSGVRGVADLGRDAGATAGIGLAFEAGFTAGAG